MPRLSANDPSSYSTPETEIITHVNLDWTVNFEEKILGGTAELHFKILASSIEKIVSNLINNLTSADLLTSFQFLDVDELKIKEVNCKCEAGDIPLTFNVDSHVVGIGSKLTVQLPTKTSDE